MTAFTAARAKKELRGFARAGKARGLARFFKTGKGEYGEGDRFLGVMVPQIRSVAKRAWGMPRREAGVLLKSPFHEDRLLGLLILVEQFNSGRDPAGVFRFYLRNLKYVNNWDLVDLTAPRIVGAYLGKDRRILYKLARSKVLWERRVAIISTLFFIRRGRFADTLRISRMLLGDREDLIHKAAGWMLREVGKRDKTVLEGFLRKHLKRMPRTMLRYAIERFPKAERERYLGQGVRS